MLELFVAVGIGLAMILPLANPLTTVALLMGLSRGMTEAERDRQALKASIYSFAIMVVAFYVGQMVMNLFGVSITGLRIAGGLIVAFIGFRMLFPEQKLDETPEVERRGEELRQPIRRGLLVVVEKGDPATVGGAQAGVAGVGDAGARLADIEQGPAVALGRGGDDGVGVAGRGIVDDDDLDARILGRGLRPGAGEGARQAGVAAQRRDDDRNNIHRGAPTGGRARRVERKS